MSLVAGTLLGPFQIHDRLGSGGMGEVYVATDTRLHRRVAIKVLRDASAGDADQRERLKREARIVSALQHPHICTLYDVGVSGDLDYLVLELLEGETLQERLRKGALPLTDALRVGSEIASALAAAHGEGVVHRDLKPANVMLTRSGVKLLDFGLAKAVTFSPAHAETRIGTAPVTAEGLLAGTLPYMSPEQVQGQPVDARTDIFALGLVLHEMVTGRRVFDGSNQASLIARILDHDPPALHTLVPLAPAALSHVVQGCLEKDPKERWQSAHDVHRLLDSIRSGASSAPAGIAPSAGWTRWIPWAALAASIIVAGSAWLLPAATSAPQARRLQFRVDLGDARLETLDVPELSPDGTRLAYGAVQNGIRHLFVHDLQTQTATALPGTTGAMFPFWAPDGEHIAYFAQGSLRRIAAGGGASHTLAPAGLGAGGAWAGDTILFAPTRTGALHRMGLQESASTPLGNTEAAGARPAGFVAPSFLPDGDRYFSVALTNPRGLYLGSLREGWLHHLMEAPFLSARYSAGHVLYVQGRRLVGRPLDLKARRFTGPVRTIAEGAGSFSALPDGTIAHREPEAPRQLTWVDRTGAGSSPLGDPDAYMSLAMAPRGRRAAVSKSDDSGNVDIWEIDTVTGILSRLTSHPGSDDDAAWSPDERRLAFTSNRGGASGVYVKDLETGKESVLHAGPTAMHVDGWTPDGTHVVARTVGREVFVVPVLGGAPPRMVADTPYTEDETHVSPDGRWIAFNSNESSRYEVYVAAFPSFTSKRQVSKGGGVQPLWRGDGREIFYLAPDGSMMSVAIDTSNGLAAAAPRRLFATNVQPSYQLPQYAVTADGKRFLLLDRGPSRPHAVHVLLNWLSAPES